MKRNGRLFPHPFSFFVLISISLLVIGCGDGGVRLGPPVALPHAGLRVAFPDEFAPALLRTPTNVLAATGPHDGAMLFLLAIPMPPEAGQAEARKMADHLAAQTAKWSGVTERKVLSDAGVRCGPDRPGWRTVVRLVSDGAAGSGQPTQTRTSVITAWVAPRIPPQKTLGYAIWLTAEGENADALTATCDAVWASAADVPIAPPWSQPAPACEIALDLGEEGFHAAIPRTWHLQRLGRGGNSDVVLAAAVANYAGTGSPKLAVSVTPAPDAPAGGPQGLLERFADDIAASAAAMGAEATWTLDEKRLTQLAGQTAAEVRGRLTVKGLTREQISRQTWRDGNLYTLVVSCPAEAPGRAQQTMQNLAATFRFVE
jgi:hypothetical protein